MYMKLQNKFRDGFSLIQLKMKGDFCLTVSLALYDSINNTKSSLNYSKLNLENKAEIHVETLYSKQFAWLIGLIVRLLFHRLTIFMFFRYLSKLLVYYMTVKKIFKNNNQISINFEEIISDFCIHFFLFGSFTI